MIDTHRRRARAARPQLDPLEGRLLLFATSGDMWYYANRITYSFVPDGTSLGGVPSDLNAALNAEGITTAAWQTAIEKAAAVWEDAANINLVQVSDNGEPSGTYGDQQGDPNVGDIRIGGFAQSGGILAYTLMPPPANGGTDAGDIFFNTSQHWTTNGGPYDLETVAIHEIGHALGMDQSQVQAADMYASYLYAKQTLTSDDIAGIQSIYGAPAPDAYEGPGGNNTSQTATDLTSYFYGQDQIALGANGSPYPSISSSSDTDWYKFTIPSDTSGTLQVSMQTAGLSSLAPRIAVYSTPGGTLKLLGQAMTATPSTTVTFTVNPVAPGQVYYVHAMDGSSIFAVGSYSLLVNAGSSTQAPTPPPYTTVPSQPDQGGGTSADSSDGDPRGVDILHAGAHQDATNRHLRVPHPSARHQAHHLVVAAHHPSPRPWARQARV
jgi:hypothetical protein